MWLFHAARSLLFLLDIYIYQMCWRMLLSGVLKMSMLISCIIDSCTLCCALDVVGPVKEECMLSFRRYHVVNYLGASHTLLYFQCELTGDWSLGKDSHCRNYCILLHCGKTCCSGYTWRSDAPWASLIWHDLLEFNWFQFNGTFDLGKNGIEFNLKNQLWIRTEFKFACSCSAGFVS